MMKIVSQRAPITFAMSALFVACGEGRGSISVETWGEEYIELGIPETEFVDGWSVHFSRFVIALGGITVADRDGNEAARDDLIRVFDLSKAGPHLIQRFDDVAARRWDFVSVRHEIARSAVGGHSAVALGALGRMNDEGLSLLVSGTAATGTVSKSFDWPFARATAFSRCRTDDDGPGVVVPDGEDVRLQFTIHGDHLFYDSLEDDAELRFAALAGADRDGDGDVTLEEMAAVDLTTLPSDQYSTAGAGTITNLREFVEAQARTLVHFRGDGHCEAAAD